MRTTLCTIVTPDYLDRAISVRRSVERLTNDVTFVALTTEDVSGVSDVCETLLLSRLREVDVRARRLSDRYGPYRDELRWSLKPILLRHVLDQGGADRAIYVDSDTCFFRDPLELFELLDGGSILLTPHWRPPTPQASSRDFELNFLDGLFNAGCVAATKSAGPALDWWADACLHACENIHERGRFFDQRYLDLIPVYFRDAVICRHRGYNLADWNVHLREGSEGRRDVPDVWPVSMVHFTGNTTRLIDDGRDPVLAPYLELYRTIRKEAEGVLATVGPPLGAGRPSISVSAATPAPRVTLGDLHEAARRKTFSNGAPPDDVVALASRHMSTLSAARFRAVACDYDGTFGGTATAIAASPDRSTVDVLSRLLEAGMVLGISSRRGTMMIDQLRTAFPAALHRRILIAAYSGSCTGTLDSELARPSYDRRFDELREWLSTLPLRSTFAVEERLSRGGQLSLTAHELTAVAALHAAVHTWLRTTERHGWRVFRARRAVEVLLPHVSKARVIDAMKSRYGLDGISDVLRIADSGHEEENDFELLAAGLSLSSGSVSTDPRSAWNLCAPDLSRRDASLSYLRALRADAGQFRFVAEPTTTEDRDIA